MEWLTAILLSVGLALVSAIVDSVWWYGTQTWPPSPPRFPLLGNPLHFVNANYKSFKEIGKKYGAVFSLHLLHKHIVIVNDWRTMKEAVIDKADIFSLHADLSFAHEILGTKGITLTDGPVWKEKRRFTLFHLRNFGIGKTIMEDAILEEVSKMEHLLQERLGDQQQVEMKINQLYFFPAVNVIWQMVGGKTYEYDDEEMKKFADIVKENLFRAFESFAFNFMPLLKLVPFDPYHVTELKSCTKQIYEAIEKAVEEHEKTRNPDEEPRDYIDAYLAEIERKEAKGDQSGANECYQRSHLVSATFDIFQAGVETTTTTMEWALLYMAIWPEVQTRVQEELDTVIGRNRKPRYSDKLELPYTRATIMEVQRYSSLNAMCAPRKAARATELGGQHVPKGASVIMNLWAIHNDEAYWGDPEVFRPSRFIDDQGQLKKHESLVPFSAGPRICLGESLARMELFLFFTCMLQSYTVRYPTGHSLPPLEPVQGILLEPQMFNLVVKQRT